RIADALRKVAESPDLLAGLETKSGFVIQPTNAMTEWPDWRGPGRKGIVPHLPTKLPARLPRIWSSPLSGPPMAGPAVIGEHLVIPDKSSDGTQDIFRCLNALDGHEIWRFVYDAPDDLEYS